MITDVLDNRENSRIRELKDKLNEIAKYVVDDDKLAELLIAETKTTDLNETNFYKALNETDNINLFYGSEPKNLYLKLKEKMNRDDIMKILSEKADSSKLVKAARRMIENDHGTKSFIDNDVVDIIVDKMIAEKPRDDHTFDFNKDDNKYWDPQGELEDLKEYHQHDGRRIFKGERTTIKHYPFMASIHVMGRFWCGGVLYWHDLVLTSASCLQLMHNNRYFRENPKALYVRIGSNHSRIGGESIHALEVFFHPGYNPRSLKHNIAIIRLRRHLFFGYHRVPKIINLSPSAEGLAPTSEVLVLGWGVTKMSQRLAYEPVFLNRKFLPIYPNIFCKEIYGDKFISSTMFCAGTMTTGEGACDHDAGGPAVLAGKLVGLISFGPAICGYPNAPTVFTLVGAYMDWIESVNETMPDYYKGKKRTTTPDPFTLFEDLKFSKMKFSKFTSTDAESTITTALPTTTTPAELRNRFVHADEGWSLDID
ncbi:transmembrane protease serine 9-like [Zerene cesonia]|uniref:transmembrane protease serine 9-like n=1 Tax=Zerene cesonia TaxID=33412 RepID=UPI0018E58F41|nr:transmembrane protease serine 9-like [Zerene cesonia]